MSEVQDEIWALLAKYLCGEATSSECILVEILLKENAEVRNFYQLMEMNYMMNETQGNNNALKAFAQLDRRIKKAD